VRIRTPGIFIGFCALAVFWTWPVAATLSARLAHDQGDPVLNTWILRWNAETLPFTSSWWNPPIMWPMSGTMALSETLVGLSLFATPLQWAGASPVAAYNVCVLLTYALSGFFGYLLGRRLTGSEWGGFCAGLAFGFSPYRAGQISHIQVLASHWMPLLLLAMHVYVETGRTRWLAVFGTAWILQALSNGYYLLFLPVLIGLWLIWFVDWRQAPRRGLMLIAAWIAASAPLVPILLKYRAIHDSLGLTRTLSEIRDFSAVPGSFISTAPLLQLWQLPSSSNYEQYLFPGAAAVALTCLGLIALVSRRQLAGSATLLFYTLAAFLMFVLALGPGGDGAGPTSPLRPYTWLLWLPGYDGLRVPARFTMVATLCLAIAASGSLARVIDWASRWRTAIAALALAAVAADGLTTSVPTVTPPGRVVLPPLPADAVVLEVPPDTRDVSLGAMYRSIFHRHDLVNGYSGHIPPHYDVLSVSLWRGDTSVLFYLARRRPLVLIVNDRFDKSGFRAMIEAVPGIQLQGVVRGGAVFVLPAQPEERRPSLGPQLPGEVRDAGRFKLEFDLGRVQPVSALRVPIRKRFKELADRLLVETSEDGQSWRETWRGWTGALALDAMLADPRTGPLQIPLATTARYVRVYPASEWMRTELTVH
jgi:hypothetical protein